MEPVQFRFQHFEGIGQRQWLHIRHIQSQIQQQSRRLWLPGQLQVQRKRWVRWIQRTLSPPTRHNRIGYVYQRFVASAKENTERCNAPETTTEIAKGQGQAAHTGIKTVQPTQSRSTAGPHAAAGRLLNFNAIYLLSFSIFWWSLGCWAIEGFDRLLVCVRLLSKIRVKGYRSIRWTWTYQLCDRTRPRCNGTRTTCICIIFISFILSWTMCRDHFCHNFMM